jgi:hypothetical protein
MSKMNQTEKIMALKSVKQLVKLASTDLQNDIRRERGIEAYTKLHSPEVLEHPREICEAQGIQGPEYWRGLRYGWRYVQCYVEALQMRQFEQKRLMKALEGPIVGEHGTWDSRQDFEADLGNDNQKAFFALRDIVSKIIGIRKAA